MSLLVLAYQRLAGSLSVCVRICVRVHARAFVTKLLCNDIVVQGCNH